MRPADPISHQEAAHILGCSVRTVARHISAGRLSPSGPAPSLSRSEVEELASQVYRWRRRQAYGDPDSYWVTGSRAAEVLGIDPAYLDRVARREQLSYVVHADGTAMFRRHELQAVANDRSSSASS